MLSKHSIVVRMTSDNPPRQNQIHAGTKRPAPTSFELPVKANIQQNDDTVDSCAIPSPLHPITVTSASSSHGNTPNSMSVSTSTSNESSTVPLLSHPSGPISVPMMTINKNATMMNLPQNHLHSMKMQYNFNTTPNSTHGIKQQQALEPLNRKNKNLSEKKLRRLEKNRISARNCRRKKKEVTQNLQREINILEGENLRLRLQLQIGQEAEQNSKEEQDRVTEGLDALLKSGASDSEIFMNIEEFKAKYADYGRDRRSAIDFHLRNVERLLMPTTTTTVAMRALDETNASGGVADNQNISPTKNNVSPAFNHDASTQNEKTAADKAEIDEIKSSVVETIKTTSSSLTSNNESQAYNNQKAKQSTPVAQKSLFQYLVNYLKVTPSQAAALKDSRHVAKELDSALVKSLSMVKELRETLTQCTDDLDAEFTTIRSILTPRQAAKFLVWVANNDACMHMLNELWRRQYPEPTVIEDVNIDTNNNDSSNHGSDNDSSSTEKASIPREDL